MINLNQRIENEVDSLLETGVQIARQVDSSPYGLREHEISIASAWVTRLGRLIRDLYGIQSQHYESYDSALKTNNFYNLHNSHIKHFSRMVGVIKAIKNDVDNGQLINFKTLIQA